MKPKQSNGRLAKAVESLESRMLFSVTSTGSISPFIDASKFSSIQAAIDSLPAGGGTVYIPAGTYYLPTSLNLTNRNYYDGPGEHAASYVTLQGAGSNTVLIGTMTSGPVIDLTNSSYANVSNLQIQSTSARVGILLARVAPAVKGGTSPSAGWDNFTNVTISGSFSIAGVYDVDSEVNHWTDCQFANSYAGGCGFIFAHNNIDSVTSPFVGAIASGQSNADQRFANCVFNETNSSASSQSSPNAGAALRVCGWAEDVTLTGCFITTGVGVEAGVWLDGTAANVNNVELSQNQFVAHGNTAIFVSGSAVNCRIDSNYFSYDQQSLASAGYASYFDVSGNSFSNNGTSPLAMNFYYLAHSTIGQNTYSTTHTGDTQFAGINLQSGNLNQITVVSLSDFQGSTYGNDLRVSTGLLQEVYAGPAVQLNATSMAALTSALVPVNTAQIQHPVKGDLAMDNGANSPNHLPTLALFNGSTWKFILSTSMTSGPNTAVPTTPGYTFTSAMAQSVAPGSTTLTVTDAASIQAAIDSLPASGGTIYLPAGVYVLSHPLNFTRRNFSGGTLNQSTGAINLVGAGYGTIIESSVKGGALIDLTGSSYCNLSNLQLHGNGQQVGVLLGSAASNPNALTGEHVFTNVWINGTFSVATVYNAGSSQDTWQQCTLQNLSPGADVMMFTPTNQGGVASSFTGTMSGNGNDSGQLVSNCILMQHPATGMTGATIDVRGGVADLSVTQCDFGVSNVAAAVELDGSSAALSNVAVTDNRFEFGGAALIVSKGLVTNVTYEGNSSYVTASTGQTIASTGTASGWLIDRNQINQSSSTKPILSFQALVNSRIVQNIDSTNIPQVYVTGACSGDTIQVSDVSLFHGTVTSGTIVSSSNTAARYLLGTGYSSLLAGTSILTLSPTHISSVLSPRAGDLIVDDGTDTANHLAALEQFNGSAWMAVS